MWQRAQLQKILWLRLFDRRGLLVLPLLQGFLVLEDNVYPSEEGHAALILGGKCVGNYFFNVRQTQTFGTNFFFAAAFGLVAWASSSSVEGLTLL